MGCRSGLVIGISIGYYLTSWKDEWHENLWKEVEKMDKGRKNGVVKQNLTNFP